VFSYPWPYAYKRPEVHNRGIHGALHRELLYAMQEDFAFGFVALDSLLLEEFVNIRIAAIGIGALRIDKGLNASREYRNFKRYFATGV
jgi:hypothetical protein